MSDKRNIRIRYSGILEKIRNFMLSDKSREFLIFLFFAFVSFCFWLLQVLNDAGFSRRLSITWALLCNTRTTFAPKSGSARQHSATATGSAFAYTVAKAAPNGSSWNPKP